MSYSPIGQIYFEYTAPHSDESSKIRNSHIWVASKKFRSFFAFGMDGKYRPPEEKDKDRDELFNKWFVEDSSPPKNWKKVIRSLDFELSYAAIYYLSHYLRDNKCKKISKDKLVNHLFNMGCNTLGENLNAVYEDIKK